MPGEMLMFISKKQWENVVIYIFHFVCVSVWLFVRGCVCVCVGA